MTLKRRPMVHRFVLAACAVVLAPCAAFPVVLAAAPLSSFTELLSYGAPLWFLASLCVTAAMAACGGLRTYCAAPFVTALACLVAWGPWPAAKADGTGETFEVVTHNLSFANGRPHEAVAYLAAADAVSIAAVLEVSQSNRGAVGELSSAYPYWEEEGIGERAYGLMLFSKTPLTRLDKGDPRLPKRAIAVRTYLAGRPVRIVAVHLFSPHSRLPESHRRESEALAAYLAGVDEPLIVLGDFNSTPWSGRFRRIAADGRLAAARPSYAIMATWPAHRPWPAFPIDHILASKDRFAVAASSLGPRSGSDHYALRAALRFLSAE